jgi:hypothetical protein
MLKLAKLTGLSPKQSRLLWFPCFKKVDFMSGSVRGKDVDVFVTRSVRLPANLVARISLNWKNDSCFLAMKKRIGVSLLKILGRPVVNSGDGILDRKVVFQSNDIDFAKMIFEYEEIREKFDALFSDKFGTGTLAVGESSIFYRESSGILFQKKRRRFAVAIDLLCDLFDILYFYRRNI